MQPLPPPPDDYPDSDRKFAQIVAAHSYWLHNTEGTVFDGDGTFLASSMDDLAKVMRALGWFTSGGTAANGVNWVAVPGGENEEARRATQVRDMAMRLGI